MSRGQKVLGKIVSNSKISFRWSLYHNHLRITIFAAARLSLSR